MATTLPTRHRHGGEDPQAAATSRPARCAAATTSTRMSAAKAAALEPVAMNAVIAGRRALVHVGRPHVERHRGDLEAEATRSSPRPSRNSGSRGPRPTAGGDRGRAGRAGGAVDERDAVEQERRGERAEQEVLQRGLAGVQPLLEEPGQHVERQRHELEGQEHHDQVVGRGQQHHARRSRTARARSTRPTRRRPGADSPSTAAPPARRGVARSPGRRRARSCRARPCPGSARPRPPQRATAPPAARPSCRPARSQPRCVLRSRGGSRSRSSTSDGGAQHDERGQQSTPRATGGEDGSSGFIAGISGHAGLGSGPGRSAPRSVASVLPGERRRVDADPHDQHQHRHQHRPLARREIGERRFSSCVTSPKITRWYIHSR